MFLLLAIVGGLIGAVVNHCIYQLGDEKSPASPWINPPGNTSRNFLHYLPIVGWLLRLNESEKIGSRFWFRPMCIEFVWIFGLPLFFVWLSTGGLTSGVAAPDGWVNIWCIGYTILFALLFVATFIDFDQRIIPDSITIPGTLIALAIAAFWPSFKLPKLVAGLAAMTIEPLHFADGAPLPTWHFGIYGVVLTVLIFIVWILAMLPKHPLIGLNWHALKIVYVSTVRLLQSNGLKVREKTRRLGWNYLSIGAIGAILIVIAWTQMGKANWTSFFGAIVGLGFGGLSIWMVRIVASHSLGQEAMGFGDVTLMAMIGAFLGWQAALVSFALSPFTALAIVLVNFLITKENELAFGPYLCAGAAISIFGWSRLWPHLKFQFFAQPFILLAVLGISLILLMVMMLGVRKMKGLDDPENFQ